MNFDKINFLIIFFLLTICISNTSSKINEKKLKYVQAVWRSGDRAPEKKPYQNDKYDESFWPRGWSQLTTLGMSQMHELGQFFHDRYVGSFLSHSYKRREVYVHSSNIDRAIESAQALLSGMFPPSPNDRFDNNLNWQPIPVHSVGKDKINILRPSDFDCPRYKQLKKDMIDPLEDRILSEYANFSEALRTFLSIEHHHPVLLENITQLRDIQIEMIHNLTQPDWIKQKWPEYGDKSTFEIVMELSQMEREAEFNGTREMARLSGGYLLGDWLRRAKDIANGTKNLVPVEKMVLYSAHDSTVLALLSALGNVQGRKVLKLPPYAACVIMEIYELENQYLVELHFRRNQHLERLTLRGCSQSCALEEFVGLTESSAIYGEEQLYEECGTQMCVMVGARASSMNTSFGLMFMTYILIEYYFEISIY